MSSQSYLSENPPMILDSTCSFSKIWPAHASLRMDCRIVVNPDIVADVRCLPFRDESFDEIYCDPPHMIRSGKTGWIPTHDIEFLKKMAIRRRLTGRLSPDEFVRYSWFNSRAEMDDFFERSLNELARTLKPSGTVHFKLTESSKDGRYIKIKDFKLRTSAFFEITSDKSTDSKSNFPNGNKVHWIKLKPNKAVLEAVRSSAVNE